MKIWALSKMRQFWMKRYDKAIRDSEYALLRMYALEYLINKER
jgi:hypothetical protein